MPVLNNVASNIAHGIGECQQVSTGPNFLVLMSDQHNPNVMGCEGDLVVRTPNLDYLAARGVLFENCYCPAPLCVPSRMSFMTARSPSGNGVWSNYCRLSSNVPTFAHTLSIGGYETVLAGHMHFIGPDQRHGFEKRLGGTLAPAYLGGPWSGLTPELLGAAEDMQSRRGIEVAGPGRTGYHLWDEMVAEASIKFLRTYGRANRQQRRPFCLVVGFISPHPPFVSPRDDFNYYLDRVTLPVVPEGYFEGLHPAMKLWRRNRGVEDLTEDEIRRARAGYYGLVTHLDRQVGKVLEALEQSNLAQDTVVIYASDHGEMAGEHGMWWKSNFYEGSVSVPLIVSWSGQFASGERLCHIVNLADIAPTILGIAGVGQLPDTVGSSLVPLLRGEQVEWSNETFSEHALYKGVPTIRMMRRGPWKLVHYEGYRPQLFNLEKDPEEFHDLGDNPHYEGIRQELTQCALTGWSASHIEETLARRTRARSVLTAWFKAVQPPSPEQWVTPAEANLFPDDVDH